MVLVHLILVANAIRWFIVVGLEQALITTNKALRGASTRVAQGVLFVVLAVGVLYGPLAGIAAAPESTNSIATPTREIVAETFTAIVTQYSYTDSCHNIRNGKCLMASGKPVYLGAVACPSFLALGTKIEIDGKEYACEDRYAHWLDRVREYPTVDIFVAKYPHGNQPQTITIVPVDRLAN